MLRSLHAPLCALTFAVTKLSVDVYQSFYHGIGLHWPSVLFGLVVVSIAGTIGYICGALVLGKPGQRRAVFFIALISFFVSTSLAHLLASVVTSLWMFLAGLCAIAFVVTVWIGPRWDPPA